MSAAVGLTVVVSFLFAVTLSVVLVTLLLLADTQATPWMKTMTSQAHQMMAVMVVMAAMMMRVLLLPML